MKKLLLLLLISCFLLASCGKSEMKAPELMDPVSANVDTVAVSRGDIVNVLTYDGSLVPASIELYFETDGIIDVIAAYSGKYVNEGDALITLDGDDAYATCYCASEALLSLIRRLASANGLFVWDPDAAGEGDRT